MNHLLEIHDLRTYYLTDQGWVRALDGINLWLDKGKTLGIAGETGSGKTTLAFSILRLLPPNARIFSGKIIFEGTNLLELDENSMNQIRQKRISLIIQGTSDALNPLMEAGWQVEEAIEYHEDVTLDEALDRVKKLFEEVELGSFRIINLPHELSIGMKQRVKIALAISTHPDLIIADEPFMGLDPPLQMMMINLLEKFKEKYAYSMIFMTHNLALLAGISDHIAIIYAGKLMEFGPTRDVFKHPIHPYTKGLIGAIPDPRYPKRRRLIYIPGAPPSLINPPKGCIFRPRCPIAKDICKIEPPLKKIGDSLVSCHFAEEIADIPPWEFWSKEIAYY